MLVNCFDWAKRQRFFSVDWILCYSTGILQDWFALDDVNKVVCNMFNSAFYSLEVFRTIINIAWTISHHFSIWLSRILSIFYLLKIPTFSSLMFLYLKWTVKNVLFAVHLGSVVLLVPHLAVVSMLTNMKYASEYEGNITWKISRRHRISISCCSHWQTSYPLLCRWPLSCCWSFLYGNISRGCNSEAKDPRI